MMLKRIISAIFLLALLGSSVFADSAIAESSGTAMIENNGKNRYKSIRLTPEIYNHASRNLSDLRLVDDRGEYVPYFIFGGLESHGNDDSKEYVMTLMDSYDKENNFYFDYAVSDIPEHDITATSLVIGINNSIEFAKHIELFGSYDGINWTFVQNDTLYNIGDNIKNFVSFNDTLKFTHYRFILGNNLERISFSSVKLLDTYEIRETIYFIENMEPTFTVEEKDKNTYINIEGLRNVRLVEINIDTDSMFKRNVRSPFGNSKELYNLSFNEASYSDTAMQFNMQTSEEDTFTLIINNGDDKPISLNGLSVKYYADELVFEDNQSAKYTLHFDMSDSSPAPIYDIERYKNEVLKENIDRLEVMETTFIGKEEKQEQYDYSLIFNISVVCVAVLLGALLLTKLKKKA